MPLFNDRRNTDAPKDISDVPYGPAEGKNRQDRYKAGAPLARGVKGRTQALMNMTPQAREVAEIKTAFRANRPQKGKPYGNIVNQYNGNVTGSTGKQRRFDIKSGAKVRSTLPKSMGGTAAAGGGGLNINDLNR